jgi:hypothetical protein
LAPETRILLISSNRHDRFASGLPIRLVALPTLLTPFFPAVERL